MRAAAVLGFVLLLAACAKRPPPPTPAAPPPPPPVIALPPADWRDLPLTAGRWRYAGEGATSVASFGGESAPLFTMRCDPARRTVTLAREGSSATADAVALTVTTSHGSRRFPAQSLSSRRAIAAEVAASDPFLDRIVFSRGRVSVDATGTPRIVMPSWAEPGRVVEDCRL